MRLTPALRQVGLLFVLLVLAGRAAADQAQDWLEKAALATRLLNYSGVYVYQHGGHIELMRVLHRVDGGREQERTEVIEGLPRSFLRIDKDVYCHLPNGKVRLEHDSSSRFFPAILPAKPDALTAVYEPVLGGQDRVAGAAVQVLWLKPRDAYRHAYEFWLDRRSGLPLKVSLVSTKGAILSTFMFSEVQIGTAPEASLFKNDLDGKTLIQAASEQPPDNAWQVTPPPGYTLLQSSLRKLPGRDQPVTHQLYSDGLSALSLFIEPAAGAGIRFKGLMSEGGIVVYSRLVDGYKVTAMGEVPGVALIQTGNSVRRP